VVVIRECLKQRLTRDRVPLLRRAYRDHPTDRLRPVQNLLHELPGRGVLAAVVADLVKSPVPGSGIPYSSVIVEVTPDEFEKIQLQELKLRDGWAIVEEYPKGNG
jgi:hypothetical protein